MHSKWDPLELRKHALAHESEYVTPFVSELNIVINAWEELGLKRTHGAQH